MTVVRAPAWIMQCALLGQWTWIQAPRLLCEQDCRYTDHHLHHQRIHRPHPRTVQSELCNGRLVVAVVAVTVLLLQVKNTKWCPLMMVSTLQPNYCFIAHAVCVIQQTEGGVLKLRCVRRLELQSARASQGGDGGLQERTWSC